MDHMTPTEALRLIAEHPEPKDFYQPDTLRNIIGDFQAWARAALANHTVKDGPSSCAWSDQFDTEGR